VQRPGAAAQLLAPTRPQNATSKQPRMLLRISVMRTILHSTQQGVKARNLCATPTQTIMRALPSIPLSIATVHCNDAAQKHAPQMHSTSLHTEALLCQKHPHTCKLTQAYLTNDTKGYTDMLHPQTWGRHCPNCSGPLSMRPTRNSASTCACCARLCFL
jgi:hypothetical protein